MPEEQINNSGEQRPENNIEKKSNAGRIPLYESLGISKRLKEVTKWKIQGLSNIQIAKNLGISEPVFYEYLLRYQEFREAIEKGKIKMITELENAAFKSATGHTITEKKIEQDATGETKVTITEKYIPPNPAQNIFMLKNLMPKQYKDKIETEHTVNINVNKLDQLPLEELVKMLSNSEEMLKNAGMVDIDANDYDIE